MTDMNKNHTHKSIKYTNSWDLYHFRLAKSWKLVIFLWPLSSCQKLSIETHRHYLEGSSQFLIKCNQMTININYLNVPLTVQCKWQVLDYKENSGWQSWNPAWDKAPWNSSSKRLVPTHTEKPNSPTGEPFQVLLFSAAAAHRPCLCFPQEGTAKPSVFFLKGEEGKGPTAAAPTGGLCVQRTKCLETEQAPSSSTTGKHC